MYTICWSNAETERWERCENLCEASRLLLREGLINDEEVLVFTPEADEYTETPSQLMGRFQQQLITQMEIAVITKLLINGKIEFECVGSESSQDCVLLKSPLFMEERQVLYIPKMSWENIEDYLARQVQRLNGQGKLRWKARHDKEEAKKRNPYLIDKLIADLSLKCYLSAKQANKGRSPESYTLSPEAVAVIVTKQNYLDGILSEEEYQAYCRTAAEPPKGE